ncbi:uncharacterized protein LOC142326929 [Lycorma delicatula]|uniref:uncharacterized protein LOC142326929 n=1 Tax=Lycorma delicatula TaxID=130591 RepID=UPI003F512471
MAQSFIAILYKLGTCGLGGDRIVELGAGCVVLGLKNVRVNVPVAVPRGDNARLFCYFDLEGDALYSVKWYFGAHEFYRYTPRESPAIKIFQLNVQKDPLLNVDASMSNATQVTLKRVPTTLTGRYSCEVSADAPSFHTALVSGDMTVVVTPRQRPQLMGIRPRYRIGDTLRANCTSTGSRPAANLTWVLNDQPVNSKHVRQYREVQQHDLETSTTILELPLTSYHFTQHGRLKVRCAASIHNIYWQSTEKSAEEERPRGTLVNDVEEPFRHRPDEDDVEQYEDQFNPTSTSFHSNKSIGVLRASQYIYGIVFCLTIAFLFQTTYIVV